MKGTEALGFLREDEARAERHAALTEGMEQGYVKNVVESMLDTNERLVNEETDTSKIAVFTNIAKPLIRRIMPQLVANTIVSIQPMEKPTQKVFYLDFEYDTDQSPTVKGDRLDWQAGKFNALYASGVAKGEIPAGLVNGSNKAFQTKYFPLKPDSLTVYVDSVVTTSFTIDETTGAIVFGTAPSNGASVRVDYALDMEHLGSKGNTAMAGIALSMSGATVDAEEKRLSWRASKNAEQDLRAYFGLSIDSELTKQLGDQTRREIDRLIIGDLYAGASAGNTTWSKTVPGGVKLADHYETLMHAIADASMDIYRKRLVHANFIVCSPDTINMLDKTNRMVLANGGQGQDGWKGNASISAGANVFGSLSSRYTVITDPMVPANKVLVGYKCNEWNETGYVYAPYSLVTTDTWMDPNTFKMVKGLATRFGRHLVNGDFYSTVTITA